MAMILDDLHALLDRRWNDWQTRLILADWLDEFGTTEVDRLRARGYRELGHRRIRPYLHPAKTREGDVRKKRWQFWSSIQNGRSKPHLIPGEIIGDGHFGYNQTTRRALEDDFALRIGRYLTLKEKQ